MGQKTTKEIKMAATKKSIEVQKKKGDVRECIRRLAADIRTSCNMVPAAVINGDAALAAQWKAAAEDAITTSSEVGRSLSLNDLNAKCVKLQGILRQIQNPVRLCA
jgi:predicted translin family RNA/ssDNA-binding protein